MAQILVLTATAFEQAQLKEQLADRVEYTVSRRTWCSGRGAGGSWRIVETGIGAVNTAHALTCVLESERPQLVLQLGVGGAYLGSGLGIGDIALASEEVYGDIGVRTGNSWQDASEIGIPVLQLKESFYNRFVLDRRVVEWAEEVMRSTGMATATGTFVTVQECSGTAALGRERSERFAAICENMEGAAAAHLCRLYEVPFIELRGVSNMVEDRRKETWDLPKATANAQRAALELLRRTPDLFASDGRKGVLA